MWWLIKGGVANTVQIYTEKNIMLSQIPFLFKDQALTSLPLIMTVGVLTFIILSSF